ncbi:MAG: hypothetical protein AVDCRST_MAG42-2512 [uncultured Chthoniobacterales bacterium]|uniref:Uncharacterized protein n=1 Tax=uncultured Chthoniobacterales bacterium TaxID=1836801 RepID=A0A6J4IM16_9BACT|nr:MAG: hypothetical protein AVDCRST_MAG42-2512 [uncultured Chthoniobacterales bacterium]
MTTRKVSSKKASSRPSAAKKKARPARKKSGSKSATASAQSLADRADAGSPASTRDAAADAVDECIRRNTDAGAQWHGGTTLNAVPVEQPDDVAACLNGSVLAASNNKFAPREVKGTWTVQRLKGETRNRVGA